MLRKSLASFALLSSLVLGQGCPYLYRQENALTEQLTEQQQKNKTAVLLIDMQDYFLKDVAEAELEKEIPHQIAVLRYAQQHGLPIYVLELERPQNDDRKETTQRLKMVLNDGHYRTIIKREKNGFQKTNLESLLSRGGVEQLVLMGVYASFCVQSTARGAIERGYSIITSPELIADAAEAEGYYESIDWYERKGKVFATHEKLLEYLKE
ncbi:cysteine hydrolase [Candidatus Woesearchaeota archaeon]|nr:cysteine hydrolase [Candidatus Woesearchaeota archaeon]